jgi:hypothetical protein
MEQFCSPEQQQPFHQRISEPADPYCLRSCSKHVMPHLKPLYLEKPIEPLYLEKPIEPDPYWEKPFVPIPTLMDEPRRLLLTWCSVHNILDNCYF